MHQENNIQTYLKNTSLGNILVHIGSAGILSIEFTDQVPKDNLDCDHPLVERISNLIESPWKQVEDLPLDLAFATQFQKTIWSYLQTIRPGQTRSYQEVALELGLGVRYARAVAKACASNRMAVAIPCHRVVGASGMGGYRWGLDRKQALLRKEKDYGNV